MSLPPAVSEAAFLAAVAHVGRVLAAKFRYGPHDADDIAQLVALYAWEALPRYDPARGGLEGFVYRHCANRLSNARRDELGCRTDAPCRVCYRRAVGTGGGHPDGSTCPAFAGWWARRQARANLATPIDLATVSAERESRLWADSGVAAAAAGRELLGRVDALIPVELRADYLKLLAGEPVAPARKRRVRQAVAEVLSEAGAGHLPAPQGQEP